MDTVMDMDMAMDTVAYMCPYSAYSTYQAYNPNYTENILNNGAGVQFKMVLDDTTHANVIDGSITPNYKLLDAPDTLTVGTTSFDVTSTFAIVNDSQAMMTVKKLLTNLHINKL